jgi:hypothetical protein
LGFLYLGGRTGCLSPLSAYFSSEYFYSNHKSLTWFKPALPLTIMAAVSFREEGQLQAIEELNGFRFTNRYWLLEALQAAGLINRDGN